MTGPARGYKWEDFTAGNEAALKHGAYSERKVGPLAEAYEAEAPIVLPWAAGAAFAAARRRFGRAQAVTDLLWADVIDNGLFDGDGNVRPAVTALGVWEEKAARRAADLGADPMAMAKLLTALAGLSSATGDAEGLEAIKAEGRRIIAAHEAALVLPAGDGEGD